MKMPHYIGVRGDKVRALKILQVLTYRMTPDGKNYIIPEDRKYPSISISEQYVHQHKPLPGGYYVISRRGKKSWRPADTFEADYHPIP